MGFEYYALIMAKLFSYYVFRWKSAENDYKIYGIFLWPAWARKAITLTRRMQENCILYRREVQEKGNNKVGPFRILIKKICVY